MVNLVKARAKAKKSGAPKPPPANPAAEGGGAPPPQIDKLARFKEEAGKRRDITVVAEPAPQTCQLHLLTFAIDGEQYAIEVERVVEIATARTLTRVPNAEPFVLGVMSLRGVVVTVVDVRTRLRHVRNGSGPQVIVVTDEGGPIGFDVDRVLRPVQIAPGEVEPHPVVHTSEERQAIRGVFRLGKSLTILLDLDKLLD